MTEALHTQVSIDERNIIHLCMNEVCQLQNVTLEFKVKIPESETYLLKDHIIKVLEDQGIYHSKINVLSETLVNSNTLKF
jgi:hypothetical protein